VKRLSIASTAASAAVLSAVIAVSAADTNGLAIIMAGKQDAALLAPVQAHAAREVKCSVRTASITNVTGATAMQKFESMRNPGDAAMVVLVDMPEDPAKLQTAVLRSKNMAVLNIAALRPENAARGEASETFARRVEKETMRDMAQALGMSKCPVIVCALYEHKTTKELDAKSRSLCPPCTVKSRNLLRQKGIRLTMDVPAAAAKLGAGTNAPPKPASGK
jgi:predicted Zn-dependent protease